MSESPLLDLVDKFTAAWVGKLSLVALPPLRMKGGQEGQIQRNRDIFIVTMLLASVASICLFRFAEIYSVACLERGLAAFALYRCIDIFLTLVRTGIFLNFRGDVPLREQPTWRVQRILLGVSSNYFESVAWFAVIYRQLSLTSPCQFAEKITDLHQAFNLSFSTITTIGYGKYSPDGVPSELVALLQAVIGIILIVLVVGSILALMMGSRDDAKWTPAPQKSYIIAPLVLFLVAFFGLFWLFGLHWCPSA